MVGRSSSVCSLGRRGRVAAHTGAGVLGLGLGWEMHRTVQPLGRALPGYNWRHKHWDRIDTALEVGQNYEAQLV